MPKYVKLMCGGLRCPKPQALSVYLSKVKSLSIRIHDGYT